MVSSTQQTKVGYATKIARTNIVELLPYHCARDDYSSGILLDANENAYGAPVSIPSSLTMSSSTTNTNGSSTTTTNNTPTTMMQLERYPDPYQIPLKDAICNYRNNQDSNANVLINPENVFVGVGSDEAIDLLMRIFCVPGIDSILITPPTYGMYKVCAKVNDINVIECPLTPEFDLNIQETLDAITPNVKLVFLCSPGNPTCKALSLDDIELIVSNPKSQQNTMIVIDEAYIDFSTKGTALSLLNKYSNIVVLQTLSKAFGMASIRCGFCFGPIDAIQLMNNVKAPYNINSITSEIAIDAIVNNASIVHKNIQLLLEQRTIVMTALQQMDSCIEYVYPSDSNFVLFRLKGNSAQAIYKSMADNGIVTRYRGSELHCHQCIRVTIGTPTENNAFLSLLPKTFALFEK